MTKQSLLLVVFLGLLSLLLGYNYFFQPLAFLEEQQDVTLAEQAPSPTPSPAAEESPVAVVMDEMSTQQKITQLLAVPIMIDASFTSSDTASQGAQVVWVQENNPGTVVLFGSRVSTQAATVAVELALASDLDQAKPLIAVDHEGGNVQRLSGQGFSRLQSWLQVCGENRVDAQVQLEQSVEEVASVGVDVILGPMIDTAARNLVLGSRVCSGDFEIVAERARLAATVYQQYGILPVFKHFPGIGQTSSDLHTSFDTVQVTEEEATLFRELLQDYQDEYIGVMMSHVGVENQDPTVPCSLSSSCVGQVANNFPKTLIFSDDILMSSVYGLDRQPAVSDQPEAEEVELAGIILDAVLAGNDQVIIGPGLDPELLSRAVDRLEAIYESNSIVKDRIDQSVESVLGYKQSIGKMP